jgi:hypothetical protein
MERYLNRIRKINANDLKLMLLVNAEVKKYNSVFINAFWEGVSVEDSETCIRVTRRCDPSDRKNPKNVAFFNKLKELSLSEGYACKMAIIAYAKEKSETLYDTDNISETIINTCGALEILTISLKTKCDKNQGYVLSNILYPPKPDVIDTDICADTSGPISDNKKAELFFERFNAKE